MCTDDIVARSKLYLSSLVIVRMCQSPKGVIASLDPDFATSIGTRGCFNNSAWEGSHGCVKSDGSTDRSGPGIPANILPETGTSNSIASSTPDSATLANTYRSQPTSYLELFHARRRLGQHVKRQIALREQQISTAKNQVDVCVRHGGIWFGTGITNSTDMTKYVRKDPGYAIMFQHGLKEIAAGTTCKSLAESLRGRNSGLSKFTKSSPSKEVCGFPCSEQCVNARVIYNKKHPPTNLASSIGSKRSRWTSSSRLGDDVVKTTIGHFRQDNVHPVFGCATGSDSSDLQMNDRSRCVVKKHRFIKGGKRKHETLSPSYPDPELVRIYGGSMTTSNMRKFPGRKPNMNHDSSQRRKVSGGNCISDKPYSSGITLGGHVRTDASEMSGKKSQTSRDSFSDRGTPVSTQNVPSNINVKGIIKSQNDNGRRSESLSADSSCTENGATRRVRFQCPEQDLMLARNTHPRNQQYFEDNGCSTLDLDTKYERCRNGNTKIRLQEKGCMNQLNETGKELYFRSSDSGIASPLSCRQVATFERNISIIQHFRDVRDYDDLYPGNGEATRWDDIGIDLGTLENRSLTLTGAENTSVNMADSDQSFVQMKAQNENHQAHMTSGWAKRQPVYRNTGNFSPGRSSQNRAWSVISNGSNEESEDGRASGDGMLSSHCCYLCSDTPSEKERDHSAPMSHDLPNTSLETSKRQQTAVENLERALKHGVMHAGAVNGQIGYTDGSTLRHRTNASSEGHVDLIDGEALEERVKTIRQEMTLPPRVRYRNQYDDSSKNNSSVCYAD